LERVLKVNITTTCIFLEVGIHDFSRTSSPHQAASPASTKKCLYPVNITHSYNPTLQAAIQLNEVDYATLMFMFQKRMLILSDCTISDVFSLYSAIRLLVFHFPDSWSIPKSHFRVGDDTLLILIINNKIIMKQKYELKVL
jgi:hypothetical protein